MSSSSDFLFRKILESLAHHSLNLIFSIYAVVAVISFSPFQKLVPDFIAAQSIPIAYNDDQMFRSGQSHIDSSLVSEEANLTSGVGPYSRNHNYIFFLSLKRINSVDHDLSF